MHPDKVDRARVEELTDLPNVGRATVGDLRVLGIRSPAQLRGQCACALYELLCRKTGRRHDPCVIDVFLSITSFMNGAPPRPWWTFSAERRKRLAATSAPRRRSRARR